MKKVIIGKDFSHDGRKFIKGEIYTVVWDEAEHYYLLIEKSYQNIEWTYSESDGIPPEISLKYRKQRGWMVNKNNPLKYIEDACGNCSSKCRSESGKCGLYQE
jgi:hypothetical protein